MPDFSEKELSDLADLYYSYDADDNGYLDCDEFCQLLDELIKGMSQEDKEAAFDLMDSNHDGWIKFNEFVEWWGRQ